MITVNMPSQEEVEKKFALLSMLRNELNNIKIHHYSIKNMLVSMINTLQELKKEEIENNRNMEKSIILIRTNKIKELENEIKLITKKKLAFENKIKIIDDRMASLQNRKTEFDNKAQGFEDNLVGDRYMLYRKNQQLEAYDKLKKYADTKFPLSLNKKIQKRRSISLKV